MHNHSLQLLENYKNGVICNDTSLLVLKAAKSRKVFHFGSNLKKKVPNYSPELILFWWIVLREVI